MNRAGKRILAVVLTAIMVFSTCPAAAMASLLDNDPAYNEEVLNALTDLAGSEEGAREYYDVLDEYGLLDDDGHLAESWSIRMDGRDITLDELREVLAGDYDPEANVWVDGTPVQLQDVKTMLEIEDYIAHIQETYYSDEEWTEEQLENYGSLMKQIQRKGITLSGGAGEMGASGVNHNARVVISGPYGRGYFIATLKNAADGQVVTFTVKGCSGAYKMTGKASGYGDRSDGSEYYSNDGTFTMSNDCPSLTISPRSGFITVDGLFSSDKIWAYALFDNIKNALFEDEDGNSYESLSLALSVDPAGSLASSYSGTTYVYEAPNEPNLSGNGRYREMDQKLLRAINLGAFDTYSYQFNYDYYDSLAEWIGGSYWDWGEKLSEVPAYKAKLDQLGGDVKRFVDTYADRDGKEFNQPSVMTDCTPPFYESGYKKLGDGFITFGKEFYYQPSNESEFIAMLNGKQNLPLDAAARENAMKENAFQWGRPIAAKFDAIIMVPTRIINRTRYYDWGKWAIRAASTAPTFTFVDSVAPTVKSVTADEGSYPAGSVVPIRVEFSEPVRAGARLTVNGRTIAPKETGSSNVLTFPYAVAESDVGTLTVTKVTMKDLCGRSGTYAPASGVRLTKAVMTGPSKSKAITGFSAAIGGTADYPKLNVTVPVSSNSKYTAWLASDFTPAGNGTFTSKSLSVSVDGVNFTPLVLAGETVTGGTLTASVDLPYNDSEEGIRYTAELYLDGSLVNGRIASAVLSPASYLTPSDLKTSVSVTYPDDTYTPGYPVWLQNQPTVAASFSIPAGYTAVNANKVTTLNSDGTPVDSSADFAWSSSDTTVANIDKNGRVTPTGKSGSVSFILTGMKAGKQSAPISTTTDTLRFDAGLTPFLSIPNGEMTAFGGVPFSVFWSSNICDKVDSENISFTVTVKRGTKTVLTKAVVGNAENPAAAIELPASVMSYNYDADALNVLDVEVKVNYDNKVYKAATKITLESSPATVTLNPLESYYILDTAGSLDVRWDILNFNRFSGSDSNLFRLLITKGSETVCDSSNPGTGGSDGHYTGSYTLRNLSFNASTDDQSSYRQVYTVTIQAKNGEDSTWSYDSFLLYVYDADTLKLWVNGAEADSLTMTNVPTISRMTQDEILALKRDIALSSVISANYGEYAWTEVADQLAWASSNNDVATINYQQGSLYEDIRNLSLTSFRPASDFIISGIGDGRTTITASHVLTGMSDSVDVTVETLKDKLYLFQCYPQVETELTYKDSSGTEKTVCSDSTGAAAIYEPNGIKSDVYCRSTGNDGKTYLGTFYLSELESGEQDSTQQLLYPCNNLQLRRAAYAYLYLKKPDGKPYTGKIIFRGGVYVDGNYKENAKFSLNGNGAINVSGRNDKEVALGADGKLEIIMDQTQWGMPGNQVNVGSNVHYSFLIKQGDNRDDYYPIFADIDASVNQTSFVESGDAVVNFRYNKGIGMHPFIIEQTVTTKNPSQNYSNTEDILDCTVSVGPTDSLPESEVKTVVMWWGDSAEAAENGKIKFFTETGLELAASASSQSNSTNDFISEMLTTHTMTLNGETLNGVVDPRVKRQTYLEFYRDGVNLSRTQWTSLYVCNLLGMGKVEDSETLAGQIQRMGMAMGTSAKNDQDFGDQFVGKALQLVAGGNFSEGRGSLFQMKLVPTADPTKFLGFVEVNVSNMEGNVTGVYAEADAKFSYKPGFKEISSLFAMRKGATTALQKYGMKYMDDYNKVLLRRKLRDISYELQGYMETMVYFDYASGEWKMTVLDGGFDLGGGLSYSWVWNYMVGPVPFTVELKIGGTAEVDMDAITAGYKSTAEDLDANFDTEFLTELRIYLYLKVFAGLGVDYSVVALKIGIFGQISLDMRFRWLSRPYLEDHHQSWLLSTGAQNKDSATLNGQHYRISGTIGIEFVVKFLFISYEKALYSYRFDLFNASTGNWDKIDTLWEANQKNLMNAIGALLNNGSASVSNVGGRQMLSLNLAPKMEDRDYLEDGDREWTEPAPAKKGLFKAPARIVDGLSSLQTNAYPYANPELSADGEIMVYLSDQDSADVTQTRAAFANKSGTGYTQGGVIDNDGFGDSQLVVDGTSQFAVSAWTRQFVDVRKDAGSVLTNEDQMMILNGTEVYASVYTGDGWTTTRLTENGGADVAPAVAVNGDRAIVAWRSVVASDAESITNFDQKDTILYKIYENGAWSEPCSLYNGTSGTVKGITAVMMQNGTSAVSYTLDTDSDDATITDREIVYAVVGTDGEVVRNVRATTDDKLDENPQLAVVKFPTDDANTQRFVLGWFSQTEEDGDTVSDIRLFEFDDTGVTGQKMPQSLSEATADSDVNISSNFRFAKNAETIEDLSIIWVERDEGTIEELADGDGAGSSSDGTDMGGVASEKDVLRGVKFYTYGDNQESIGFTGALNVADMPDATLIDHFDAYFAGGTRISAAVLGTTYGENGATETKTGETVNGEIVSYTVPKATSAIYTATDSYEDKIVVSGLMADYETIRLGTKTLVRFCVRNSGINAIKKLTVKVGDTTTVFNALNLMPGSSAELWADYVVPEDKVTDVSYTVTANFAKTGNVTSTGTLYLDFADLQITDAAIMDESDGKRVIQIKLNNGSDATLVNTGDTPADERRSVRLRFYSDPTFETPIDEAYLPAVTITDNADLKMIDEGGYSVQTAFDVAAYVKRDSAETVEIPDSGVPVYILAEVIRGGEVDPEFETANNSASVTCENLKVRTGQDVTLTSDFVIEGEGASATTTVTVNMQNTRLGETTTGNLIVTLLDENGEVLQQQQTYTGTGADNGFITLGGEARATRTFTFPFVGANAQVTYSDQVLEFEDLNLSSLTFSNIQGVLLDRFTPQPNGDYAMSSWIYDGTTVSVMAVTENPASTVKVKVNDGAYSSARNAISETVTLDPAAVNTITVTVTSPKGETRNYVLSVTNIKNVSVQADSLVKNYGDPDPELTYKVEGLPEGRTLDVTLTRDPGEAPGYYRVHVSFKVEGFYRIKNWRDSWLLIRKKPIIISAEAKSKEYGDPDPVLTWRQEGLVNGDALTVTLARTAGENIGSYKIDATGIDINTDNYNVIFAPANLTIGQRHVKVVADTKVKTYGAEDPPLTFKAEGLLPGDTVEDVFTGALQREAGEAEGTYAITQNTLTCNNKYAMEFVGAHLTIAQKHLIVMADSQRKGYGDADPPLTYTVEGLAPGDTPEDVFTGELAREPGESMGEYQISQNTLTCNGNYTMEFVSSTFTISKRTLTVTVDALEKTYGDADPQLTYTVTGLAAGDSQEDVLTVSPLQRLEGERAGVYAISPDTVEIAEDYQYKYELSYSGANLTIHPKTLTVTVDEKEKTYGDDDPEFTYTVTGFVNGETEAGVLTGTISREDNENAGTYAIVQNTLADVTGNYEIDYRGASLTIRPKTLTVTADDQQREYGDPEPELTYRVEGLVRGETEEDVLTGTLSDLSGENAYPNTYEIVQGSLRANGNYTIDFHKGTMTVDYRKVIVTAHPQKRYILQDDPELTYTVEGIINNDPYTIELECDSAEVAGTYEIKAKVLEGFGAYTFEYHGAELTVEKIPVTVVADPAEKTYGEENPEVTYSVKWNGYGGDLGIDPVPSAVYYQGPEDVGVYPITVDESKFDRFCDVTFVSADMTIHPKEITVTADSQTKTYGDADPELTYTVEGLAPGDTAEDVFTGNLEREEGENVGTYAIGQGTLDCVNANYTVTAFHGAELTINTKALTVTAQTKSKIYGNADPTLTYLVSGLANGDTADTVLTGEPQRDAGENARSYTIRQGSLACVSNNYDLTFRTAVFMITKRTLRVVAQDQEKSYGDPDPELTYKVAKGDLVGADTLAGSLTRSAGEDVGSNYVISKGSLSANNNYTLVFRSAKMTINPKTLEVTADAQEKTFGEEDPTLTYTVDGLAFGDTAEDILSGSLEREQGDHAGMYQINQGTLECGANYTINYTGADMTINKKPINVIAKAQYKNYGDADPDLTYTVEGLEDGDTMAGGLVRDYGEDLGEYDILLGNLNAGYDYEINYTGDKLTVIGENTLVIRADAKTKTYGDPDPELTWTQAGLVEGDELNVTLTREPGEDAGTYRINADIEVGEQYEEVIYTGADLTINKRQLTVTADPKTRAYDETEDPELTYTVTGLLDGDEISVTLAREPGETGGRYLISADIQVSDNYEVLYQPAYLTIQGQDGQDDQHDQNDQNVCPICGKVHFGGFVQKLIGFFHRIIWFFRSLFNR